MKQIIKYLLLLSIVILVCNCGWTPDNYYILPKKSTTNPEYILKRKNSIEELTIQNYTDTLFPNNILITLKKIKTLTIISENAFIKIDKDRPNMGNIDIENDWLFFNNDYLDSLTTLKNLTIQGFSFKSFPMVLSRLKSLEKLCLGVCGFTELPKDLSNFKTLKRLDLTYNEIIKIPDELVLPDSLKTLVLSNNKLSSFPVNILGSPNLTELDISNQLYPFNWANQNKVSISNKIQLINSLKKHSHLKTIRLHISSRKEKEEIQNSIIDKSLLTKVVFYSNSY